MILDNPAIQCDVKYGFLAAKPDDMISVRFIEGDDSVKFFYSNNEETSSGIYKPRIRITTRSKDYAKAYQWADAIRKMFQSKIDNQTALFLDGDIYDAGYDEDNRKEFELTFRSLIVS
jgi:hypothetical protein